MNPKIKELAEQARTSVPAGLDTVEWIEKYNKIFAESMISDCIQTLINNGYDDAAQCLQDINFGLDHPV
jgi:hypothetical protein